MGSGKRDLIRHHGGGYGQRWQLKQSSAGWLLRNIGSGLYLSHEGNNVIQTTADKASYWSIAFSLGHLGSRGGFGLQSSLGTVLNIAGGVAKNSANIDLKQQNGSDTQLWMFEGTQVFDGEGWYEIRAAGNADLALDVRGASGNDGANVQIYQANDIFTEARWIAAEILMAGSKSFSNFAIIYRANAQARIIEEEFTKCGINYTVFGSQSFYTRKEVRDLLAYCKCVVNNTDMTSFKRILGTLKGVGKVTIENIIDYAQNNCLNFHDVIPAYIKSHKISANIQYRLESVSRILAKEYTACSDILKDVIDLTDYRKEIAMVYSEDTAERLSIIDEFVVMTTSMEANTESDTMGEIIDQIALLSETKGAEKAELNAVKLMTAHSSKGLEFDTVFIIGAEEGVFPHANSLNENTKNAIEEERRLFYVAMTRAKRKLYITRAAVKKNGKDSGYINTRPSRFLNEIPKHLTEDAF